MLPTKFKLFFFLFFFILFYFLFFSLDRLFFRRFSWIDVRHFCKLSFLICREPEKDVIYMCRHGRPRRLLTQVSLNVISVNAEKIKEGAI